MKEKETETNRKNTELLIAAISSIQDYKHTYNVRPFYRIFELNTFYLVP